MVRQRLVHELSEEMMEPAVAAERKALPLTLPQMLDACRVFQSERDDVPAASKIHAAIWTGSHLLPGLHFSGHKADAQHFHGTKVPVLEMKLVLHEEHLIPFSAEEQEKIPPWTCCSGRAVSWYASVLLEPFPP